MLHCNMNTSPLISRSMALDLEDVLGSLQHARRSEDLGRLALLTYWEVRRWARSAHMDALAALASDVVTRQPFPSRDSFLHLVDQVIEEMTRVHGTHH